MLKKLIHLFTRKPSEKVEEVAKYILWVTTKCEDGGYSSRWHGWSRELILTYEQALKEKSKIEHLFYDVEIVDIS